MSSIHSQIKQTLPMIIAGLKDPNNMNNSKIMSTSLSDSYQENQYNFENHKGRTLLDILSTIQNQLNSNILNNLAKDYKLFSSSLLTYAPYIQKMIQQSEDHISLMQRHHCSQSILLSIYLTCFSNKKVGIICQKNALKQWQSYLIGTQEADPKGALYSKIENEKIKILPLSVQVDVQNYDIVIIDVFNVNFFTYKPFLLKKLLGIMKKKKCILYYSHTQENQIQNILEIIKCLDQFIPVTVSAQHPVEVFQKDNLLDLLIQFVKQDNKHPNKQDIIIFYPSPQHETLKGFMNKFHQKVSHKINPQLINIVTKPNQKLSFTKNNIFIVQDTFKLQEWGYSYSNIFYVLDYGMQNYFYMDYKDMHHIQTHRKNTAKQSNRRLSYVGVYKIGRYCYQFPTNWIDNTIPCMQDQYESNISTYCISMIKNDLSEFLQKNSKIESCLKLLKECGLIELQGDNKYKIIVEQIANYNLNPIYTNIILKNKQNKKLVNLLIMAVSNFIVPGSLKQTKDILLSKPSAIWRKTGYIHSALEIITKCQIIDNKDKLEKNSSKRSMMRKKTSKIDQAQYDVFGSLFEVIEPKKKSLYQMEIVDFIREQLINEQTLHSVRDQIDRIRQMFDLEQQCINLEKQDVASVIEKLIDAQSKSVGIYSGSRRSGYIFSQCLGLFPHKNSLLSQLNERPQYIYISRVLSTQNKRQILICNSLSADSFIEGMGKVPMMEKKSYGEVQVQFHGVSSATFKELQKQHKQQLLKFEEDFQCLIQPNQQMALIIIYCSKNKEKPVRQKFEGILNRIKQKMVNNNKIMNYLGSTNILLGNGGVVTEIIKDNYISKCKLGNLHPSCTKQDLYELFQQFFVLKSIQMKQQNQYKQYAIIEFNSQKDYYRFNQYYNHCMYMNRYMEITPIQGKNVILKRQMYVKFQWYVWKSHKKAIIQYKEEQSACNACKSFIDNPILDGRKIIFRRQQKKIYLEDLSPTTDQLFIEEAMKNFGVIDYIEILKTPIKQSNKDQQLLDFHIKTTLDDQQNLKFKINEIQKKSNGLRMTKVFFQKVEIMNKLCQKLNKNVGIMGTGRVYLSQRYTYPIVVPKGSLTIYQQLLKQVLKEIPQDTTVRIQSKIYKHTDGKLYIIVKNRRKDLIDLIADRFSAQLQGYAVDLTDLEKNIVLNQVGIANLIDIQQKYPCKLIPNFLKKTLCILAPFQYTKKIKQQIKCKVQQKFFYRISLNTKSFRHLKQNPDKYTCMEKNYHLTYLQLDQMSKCLILEGSAVHVQHAFTYLMHLIESLIKPEQEMINADVCGICCEEPSRPYRLQNCGHRFCMQCLIHSVNMALGDISMFPIKCPHCLKQMVIGDLQSLLEQGVWPKLISMAVNQYVGKNSQKYTFCFNAGCKQINAVLANHFACDACNNAFCLLCKMNYHPGLTCQQAKLGGDILFKKFMQENNIRKCPNKTCGMPIQRVDGCYRVTCNRCGKSMCFKCQANKMIAYDNYNDCYKHLTDVHGGYW